MNKQQFLLTKLAEECAEVAQRALKAQQFGFDEIQAGQDHNNAERLDAELDDLFDIIDMLNDECQFNYVRNPFSYELKRTKILKYMELSRSLGMVE